MCTRGQWHLRELTVRYCPRGGSSRGTREWVRTGMLEFARQNPHVKVRTILGPNKHPVVEGKYDARSKVPRVVDLRNKEPKEIAVQVLRLRDTDGSKVGTFSRPVYSSTPSVQGVWTPTRPSPALSFLGLTLSDADQRVVSEVEARGEALRRSAEEAALGELLELAEAEDAAAAAAAGGKGARRE